MRASSGLQGPKGSRSSGLTRASGPLHPSQLRGFYRGLSLPVCTVSLVSSVSFGTYRHCLAHICRARYGSADAKPAKTDITLSGFASGLVRVSRGGVRGSGDPSWGEVDGGWGTVAEDTADSVTGGQARRPL